MSTQRRSVHFRELPRGQQLVSKKINHGNSTSLSQEPLLSPSAKSGKEMVLHSIFSPPGMSSTQGNQSVGRKRGTQCKQIDSCKDMASRMEFLTASQDSKWHPPRLISPTAETSPQNKVVDNKLTQTPQIYLITPQSSSEESKNSGNIVGTRSLRKDTSSTKHSIPHWPSPSTTFYSPAMSSVSGESLYNSRTLSNPTTPFSFMSCIGTPASSLPNSLSPNGLMPIEVFSVANIQNCNSIQGLEQIIEALKEQNGYPSLLRFAIRRLNEACHRDREANNQNSRTESKLPDMEICYQHTDEKNSSLQNKQENSLKNYLTEAREASFHDCTLNESSLMMSLSTDDEDSSVRSNRETKAILDKKQEFDSSNKAFVSRKCDSIVEAQLNDKLQSLTQTIAQMESARSTEKEEFARKIQQLEIIKDHADIKIKTLEATVKSAADTDNGTLTRENLLWSLQKLQQQKDRLQKNLLDERSLRDQKQKESLVLHHRLSKEIKDLQKQLSNVKTELNNRSRKSVELNTLLRSAQNNLLETKKERDDMVKCLLKLAGSDEIKIGKAHLLTKQERSELILSSSSRLERSNQAMDALKKELVESNRNLQQQDMDRQQNEQQLAQALFEMDTVTNCNAQLAKGIEEIHNELGQAYVYYEDLIASLKQHHLIQMRETELQYKNIIRSIKSEVYQSNVKSHENNFVVDRSMGSTHANRNRQKLENLEDKTSNMTEKLQLQGIKPVSKISVYSVNTKQVDQCDSSKIPFHSTLSIGRGKHSLGFKQHNHFTDNKENDLSSRVQFNMSKTIISPNDNATYFEGGLTHKLTNQSEQRRSLLRAAGGRKGLVSKLKMIRSPLS